MQAQTRNFNNKSTVEKTVIGRCKTARSTLIGYTVRYTRVREWPLNSPFGLVSSRIKKQMHMGMDCDTGHTISLSTSNPSGAYSAS